MAASAEGNESDPNLTPLLDVVLQLIMFFMITVNFVRVEPLSSKVHLPVAQTAIVLDDTNEDWVYLNVDGDGNVIVPGEDLNDPPIDRPDAKQKLNLMPKLKAYMQRRKEEMEGLARFRGQKGPLRMAAIIGADGDVREKRVFDIIATCEDAGFKTTKLRAMTRAID